MYVTFGKSATERTNRNISTTSRGSSRSTSSMITITARESRFNRRTTLAFSFAREGAFFSFAAVVRPSTNTPTGPSHGKITPAAFVAFAGTTKLAANSRIASAAFLALAIDLPVASPASYSMLSTAFANSANSARNRASRSPTSHGLNSDMYGRSDRSNDLIAAQVRFSRLDFPDPHFPTTPITIPSLDAPETTSVDAPKEASVK